MPPTLQKCIVSAGYQWCDLLSKCIRIWETPCEYPADCLTWFDGCNDCMLVESPDGLALGGCTMMMCFQQGDPQCAVWSPGTISTMPVVIDYPPPMIIDPMPPVTNPFIGNGH